MDEFSTQDFITWMERLAGLPWPMTLDTFTALATELGWTFTGYQYSFTADFSSGKRDVVVIDNKAGEVRTISFVLVKPTAEGLDLVATLNDSFTRYVTAASQDWGDPIRTTPGKTPTAAWNLPQNGIAEITRSGNKVYTTFVTPQGAIFY